MGTLFLTALFVFLCVPLLVAHWILKKSTVWESRLKRTLRVLACAWISAELLFSYALYKGDLYFGMPDPAHRLIKACNDAHRFWIGGTRTPGGAWVRPVDIKDILPDMRRSGEVFSLFQKAGYGQADNRVENGMTVMSLRSADIGFFASVVSRECMADLSMKEGKIVDLRVQAVKSFNLP